MKYAKWIMLVAIFAFVLLPTQHAGAVTFDVSADVKAATGVTISATENTIVGGNEVFGPTVTAFDFNTASGFLTLDAANGILISDHFFAIDVAATGGAGGPDVDVSYGSEVSPAGQAKGIGWKTTATFNKVTGPEGSQTDVTMGAYGTKLLAQLTTLLNIPKADLLGGFLRIRVGIYDGANAGLNAAGGEPFTNADAPGPYSGILTVTATP